MANVDAIVARIEAGAKVRIVQDNYGQEKVEVPTGWFVFKRHYKVSRDEIARIKLALAARPRTDRRSQQVVKV